VTRAPLGIGLAALALLSPPAARAADAADAGAEEPLRLEPVFVEAASANPWEYFRASGFEVISHCPDDFNRAYARALDRAVAARLAVLPADLWGELATPMKIVLYNRENAEGAGFSRARPIDLSWLSGDEGARQGPYSVVKSYPAVVGDGDTFISCGNYRGLLADTRDFSVDPDSEVLLRSRAPQLPAWFVAGLVGPSGLLADRVIESRGPGPDTLVLPAVVWVSRAETQALLKDPKRPRSVPPLRAFFADGAAARDPDGWNAEAAFLVRWGLFGGGPDRRDAFLAFVRAACSEPPTEALFRRFLAEDFAGAEASLRDYVGVAIAGPVRVALPPAPEKDPEIREASQAEVARIVGDWGRMEGRSVGLQNADFQRECLEQADRLFERVYLRKTSSPDFLAAFGLYELQAGDAGRAREALSDATGAGVVRPRAYVEYARLLLADALPFAEQGVGDLSEKDYGEILHLLRVARRQMPSLLATYQVLAHAMEHAPARPGRDDMEALDQAVRLFPRDAHLAYKVATLYRRFGYPEDAARVIARSLPLAETDEARALLSSFGSGGR